ncbi:MAG: hypothetical protein ACOZNI_34345 [Myxococcota bacterium]
MLLALASLVAEPALAKPLRCDWKGEAVDAFTGKDSRTLEVLYYGNYQIVLHAPHDGVVEVEVAFSEPGMTNNTVTKPVMFLLADASVIELPLQPGAPVHQASSYGVATRHNGKGTLPVDTFRKIAEIGVAKIRFPVPSKEYTLEMDKGDVKEFTNFALCLSQ